MSKQRTPALADWLVTFLDPRTSGPSVKIRATHLEVRGGTAFLLDTGERPLFCAPAGVVYIRRLEDGEKTAATEKAEQDPVNKAADPALASPPAKSPARRTRG